MSDIERHKRNVRKMIEAGAPESDIDAYLSFEGVTVEMLRGEPDQMAVPATQTDSAQALTRDDAAMQGLGKGMIDSGLIASIPVVGKPLSTFMSERSPEAQGRMASGIIGVGNGASLGLLDEGLGAVAGEDMKTAMRDATEMSRGANPVTTIAGEAVGASPYGSLGMRRLGAVRGGAASGAVYGATSADGGLKERGTGGFLGGVFGGLGGKVGDVVGQRVSSGVQAVRQRFAPEATDLATRQAAEVTGYAQDMGIPLTRGQAMDDLPQQAFEQRMLRSGENPAANATMRTFVEEQTGAVDRVGRSIAGDNFDGPYDAAAAARDGIEQVANQRRADIDDAYDVARSFDAKLDADAAVRMPEMVKATLPEEVRFLMDAPSAADRSLYPASMRAIDHLRTVANEIGESASENGRVAALDFRRIELARRQINSAIDAAGANAADKRIAIQVKRGLDDYLDRAVMDGLFSGDEGFLQAYQRARSLRAQFAKDFEANKVFEKLVKENPDPTQTMNFLLGAGRSVSGQRTSKVVPQLKEALGEDSEAWAAIKEAAAKRLVGVDTKGFGPEKLDTVLTQAIDGKDAAIFKELLTEEEMMQLKRFRAVVRRIKPIEGSVNRSNTAYEMARMVRDSAGNTPFIRSLWAYGEKWLGAGTAAVRARAAVNPGNVTPRPPVPGEFFAAGGVAGGEAGSESLNAAFGTDF